MGNACPHQELPRPACTCHACSRPLPQPQPRRSNADRCPGPRQPGQPTNRPSQHLAHRWPRAPGSRHHRITLPPLPDFMACPAPDRSRQRTGRPETRPRPTVLTGAFTPPVRHPARAARGRWRSSKAARCPLAPPRRLASGSSRPGAGSSRWDRAPSCGGRSSCWQGHGRRAKARKNIRASASVRHRRLNRIRARPAPPAPCAPRWPDRAGTNLAAHSPDRAPPVRHRKHRCAR